MLSGSVVTVVKPAPKLFCETVVGNFSYGSKAAEPKQCFVSRFFLLTCLFVCFFYHLRKLFVIVKEPVQVTVPLPVNYISGNLNLAVKKL